MEPTNDSELLAVNTILAAALCCGILRDMAVACQNNVSTSTCDKYDIDKIVAEIGSDLVTERAISMMVSFDPKQNKEWARGTGDLLNRVYNVVSRIMSEGAGDDDHALCGT